MTVLLEDLNRALSICGCHLFYNSLVCNPILLSLDKGSFLCVVHLHSNFELILLCSLGDNGSGFGYGWISCCVFLVEFCASTGSCYPGLQYCGRYQYQCGLSGFFACFVAFVTSSGAHQSSIFLCGDFNLPQVCWDDLCVSSDKSSSVLYSMINDLSLEQCVSIPTQGSNILD